MCQISRYIETLDIKDLVFLSLQHEKLSDVKNQSSLNLIEKTFEKHLMILENAGFDSISYRDLIPFIHHRLALLYIQHLLNNADDLK